MEATVSVIMPNYNCGKNLRETIASVIGQSYKNWELLIVDDCSTDDSVEIIKSFCEKDNRIKLFTNKKNSGAAASRNLAMQEAKGKWIAFLDSDDLWYPEKLEAQIAFMEQNGYCFSYSAYEHIDENNDKMHIVVTGPKKLTKRKMFNYCYPGCLTVMYDAEKVGLIQIPDAIANGENDYAIWLKAIKHCNCYFFPKILAQYRVRSNSLSHKSSKLKLAKNHYKLFKLSEDKSSVSAFFHMLRNLFYGFWKKAIYVKKLK